MIIDSMLWRHIYAGYVEHWDNEIKRQQEVSLSV